MKTSDNQNVQQLASKITNCMDELAALLDKIYKFPQRQREQFYERIQTLKQGLAVLRSNLKQAAYYSQQRKYQQIFLKLNQLKSEINSFEVLNVGNDENKNKIVNNRNKSKGVIEGSDRSAFMKQSNYDEIMSTVVEKQEEVKKYKQLSEEHHKNMQALERKQQSMQEQIVEMRRQMAELQNANLIICKDNGHLNEEIEIVTRQKIELEAAYSTHREAIELSRMEINRLRANLDDVIREFTIKKKEAESLLIQKAANQQKYGYQYKSFMEKQETFRVKQRNYEKTIKEMERNIEQMHGNQSKIKELKIQNSRLREDIQILEAELSIKQEMVYEKNKKVESFKTEIAKLCQEISQKSEEIAGKSTKLKQYEVELNENQRSMALSDNEMRSMKIKIGELQQMQLKYVRECKQLQVEKKVKEEDLKITSLFLKQAKEQISNLSSAIADEKKQNEKLGQQCSVALRRIDEISKIVEKLESQKKKLASDNGQKNNYVKLLEEAVKKSGIEIEDLKRKLLRAKIQCIHNIREIIL